MEYLKAKYPSGNIGLTKKEAEILNICYPLKNGWMSANKNVSITLAQYRMLKALLQHKSDKHSKKGLEYLNQHFEDNHLELIKSAILGSFPRLDLSTQENKQVCNRCQFQQEEQNNEVRENVAALLRILDDLHIAELKRQLSLK
jgi:predicted nucleotide-binding protein (sugar kinase/HSP70/actin superfamily)